MPQDIFADEDFPAPDTELPDEEEIGRRLKLEIDDAADYYAQYLAPRRAEATKRYKGEPYDNEQEGRSQIVARTMRDTIMFIMPSLLRVFFGPRNVVEFEPERPDAEEDAKQRTDAVNHVFRKDNDGFRITHDGLKDALIRDYAVAKWWWEDSLVVEQETYDGLTQEQVAEMSNDEDIEDIAFEQTGTATLPPDEEQLAPDPMLPGQPPEMADAGPQEVPIYTVRVRRKRNKSRVQIAVLPGEEFLIDRHATGIHDAKLVAHRRGVTRSQLVAMGYSPEFIDEHAGQGDFRFVYSEEAQARNPNTAFTSEETNTDDDLAEVEYTEAWRAVDRDGDGIVELHKICLIGDSGFVARIEPAPEIPFAIGTPDPEPHEFGGQGYHQILGDLERINTDVLRLTLDSFALAVTPRLEVVENQVNMMDVLNTEVGGVVRTKQPGMIANLETPFVGAQGLSMLEYLRTMVEERGGVNRASAGLDADSLQSTTKAAVSAQVTAAQQRIELLARVFAETWFKPIFAGVQRLMMRHQDVPRMIRMRGKWLDVDPRTWNAPMDVRVNVGLGTGPPEDRVQRLFGIAEKQELILQTIGPSPLVTFDRYRNTLARLVEAGGDDADSFFGEVPADWAPPAPATPPDPAQLLAEAQAKQIEADIAIAQAKLAQSDRQMLLDAELAREKMAQDQILKIKELELKHATDLQELTIKREIEQAKVQATASARQEA